MPAIFISLCFLGVAANFLSPTENFFFSIMDPLPLLISKGVTITLLSIP